MMLSSLLLPNLDFILPIQSQAYQKYGDISREIQCQFLTNTCHQSVLGVRRSIGRAGLTAETGKGLSGLEMAGIAFSCIKNVIGPCFRVTSPFQEIGGQSGPTAGRRPAV